MTRPNNPDYSLFEYVFVYGTLKKGLRGFGSGKDRLFMGEKFTKDKFYFYDYGFPAASSNRPGWSTPKDRQAVIKGELYMVSPDVLERLDRYEGVPHLFKRTTVDIVSLECTQPMPVLMYEGNGVLNRPAPPFEPLMLAETTEYHEYPWD